MKNLSPLQLDKKSISDFFDAHHSKSIFVGHGNNGETTNLTDDVNLLLVRVLTKFIKAMLVISEK